MPTRSAPNRSREQLPEQVRVRLAKLDAAARRRASTRTRWACRAPHGLRRGPRPRTPAWPPDTRTGETGRVAGRVVLVRDHGGSASPRCATGSGDLQLMLDGETGARTAGAPPSTSATTSASTGEVVTTRRGELSVVVDAWQLTAKCLRPLPDKHRGLADPEARVRQRYLDLIANPSARDMLRARSAAVPALRQRLLGRGYLEVETPMLQPIHGGANARPFVTHINAYDLRPVSAHRARAVPQAARVGGVEKVFEIGRNFRNEGVDATSTTPSSRCWRRTRRTPTTTTMRDLTRELIQGAATAALRRAGRPRRARRASATSAGAVAGAHGVRGDLGGAGRGGRPPTPTSAELRELVRRGPACRTTRRGAAATWSWRCTSGWSRSGPTLPTFYKDFPTDVSPLTRAAPRRPAAGRALGPGRVRHRARHRLLGADRPGRAAPPAHRAVAAGRRRRPGGDGARRGLPRRAGVRDAADRRARHRRRPAGHAADRPDRSARRCRSRWYAVLMNRPGPARRPHRPARHPSAGTPGAAASGPAAGGDDRPARTHRPSAGSPAAPERGGGGAGAGRGLLRLLAARPGAQPGAAAGRELPERAGRRDQRCPPGVPARRPDDQAAARRSPGCCWPGGPGTCPGRPGGGCWSSAWPPPWTAAGPRWTAPPRWTPAARGWRSWATCPGGTRRTRCTSSVAVAGALLSLVVILAVLPWPGPPSGRAGGGGGGGGRHGGDAGRRGAPRAGPGPVAADPADRAVRLAAARRRRRPLGAQQQPR